MRKKIPKPNASYILTPCKVKHEKRILAFDPGSRNMGVACIGVNGAKIHVIANSILTNPISSLVDDYKVKLTTFLAEVAQWVDLYKPDGFIMERFQARSAGGPLIELVSVMVGAITTAHINKPCRIVAASTWKNAFHRRFPNMKLDDLYKQCLTAAHPFDATMIGIFGLESGMNRVLAYDPDDIIEQVETTSCLKLRRARK